MGGCPKAVVRIGTVKPDGTERVPENRAGPSTTAASATADEQLGWVAQSTGGQCEQPSSAGPPLLLRSWWWPASDDWVTGRGV